MPLQRASCARLAGKKRDVRLTRQKHAKFFGICKTARWRSLLSDHHHDYIYWFDEFGDRHYPWDAWARWPCDVNLWQVAMQQLNLKLPTIYLGRMNLCCDTGNDWGMLWNVLQRKHWKNEVRWRAKSKRIDTEHLTTHVTQRKILL